MCPPRPPVRAGSHARDRGRGRACCPSAWARRSTPPRLPPSPPVVRGRSWRPSRPRGRRGSGLLRCARPLGSPRGRSPARSMACGSGGRSAQCTTALWRRGRRARRSPDAQRAPFPRPRVKDHRARMLQVQGIARRQGQACPRSCGCQSPIEHWHGMAGALRLPSHEAPAGGNFLVYGEYPPGKAPW